MIQGLRQIKRLRISLLMLAGAALLLSGAGAPGYAAKSDPGRDITGTVVNLALGKAEIVTLGRDVADLMLADPAIADVRMIKSDSVYIVGRQIGDTNVIALDKQGKVVGRMDVHVALNLGELRNKIGAMYPDADVKISALGEQVVVEGAVENGDRAARISRMVASYVGEKLDSDGTVDEIVENMLKVRNGQQVMLKVRMVEARRNVLRELGVGPSANDSAIDPPGGARQFFEDLEPINRGDGFDELGTLTRTAGESAFSGNAFTQARIFADSGLAGVGFLELFISALEENDLASVLAEPNLTAISGEEAGFLAGGEFPVPAGRDSEGNIEIEFKEFGVSLDFRPEVITSDRISLQLETEVSSLDFSEGISDSGGLEIPGLNVRRASTTVELNSGGSLMIAGLLQSDSVENISSLPGISQSPVLRKLAGSESFKRDETELLVIITPHLVSGYKDESQAQKQTNKARQDNPPPLPLVSAFRRNISAQYGDKVDSIQKESQYVGYMLE